MEHREKKSTISSFDLHTMNVYRANWNSFESADSNPIDIHEKKNIVQFDFL